MNRLIFATSLLLLLLGCGGGTLSMTEYSETLDLLVSDLGGKLEAMDVRVTETPTVEEARLVLGEALTARTEGGVAGLHPRSCCIWRSIANELT